MLLPAPLLSCFPSSFPVLTIPSHSFFSSLHIAFMPHYSIFLYFMLLSPFLMYLSFLSSHFLPTVPCLLLYYLFPSQFTHPLLLFHLFPSSLPPCRATYLPFTCCCHTGDLIGCGQVSGSDGCFQGHLSLLFRLPPRRTPPIRVVWKIC